MANSPPPAPPPPSIPLAPGPIPVFKSKILDEPIPKSDLGEMGTDGVGIVGGQGVVNGGDPHVGMDGGGKKKQCKNLAGSGSSAGTLIPNIIKIKFDQYWIKTYKSACIPVVLDPRFKYDFLEFLLSDFGSEEEARKWMGEVKKIMEQLFNEYNKDVSIQSQRETDTREVEDDDDPLAKWDQYIKSKRRQSSNELDRYLNEDLTPRKEEVDILEWWKQNSSKYPVLAKMARDILAIPASTVPSESAFSTGGRVISDYRSSLACSTVEALICL